MRSPLRELREKVYQSAAQLRWDGLLEQAMNEWKGAPPEVQVPRSAVTYALTIAPDRAHLAAELLNDSNPELVRELWKPYEETTISRSS